MFVHRGYTLVELMIVIMLIGIFTASTMGYFVEEVRQKRTDLTIAEIWEIGKAAKSYRVDNGEWPDQSGNCATALTLIVPSYTENIDDQSPWYHDVDNPGGVYTFSCDSQKFRVIVETDADWAGYIANSVTSTTASGVTSTSVFSLPSSVPAFAGLLHRGSDAAHPEYNQMETNIDMNNFNINNIGTATGQDFVSNIKNRSLTQAVQDAIVACDGMVITKPTCPAPQLPQIFTSVMMVSENSTGNPMGAIQSYAENLSATQWRVRLRVLTLSGWVFPTCTYGKVVAISKCT